jgi:hypothetical protein
MAFIQVTRATLGEKRLKPVTSFAFAAKTTVCEIVATEFPAIATCYPIFFVELEGALAPVALLALGEGDNLFVEADGGWSGGYVPGSLRRYPFAVQVNAQGAPTLLIDDQCGLLSDSEGEPLFGTDEASDMTSAVGKALQTITQLDVQTGPTRSLVAKIAETGIIRPVSLANEQDEIARPFAGLRAVSESALNALPEEALLELRRAGALLPIYAHLVSLGQVAPLKARNRFRQAMAQARKKLQ